MTLTAGTKLGPYEIVAPLGAGGMGEVYRARDARLNREVAIKVLPERVAADAGAMSRFEREAKAVAALSHPTRPDGRLDLIRPESSAGGERHLYSKSSISQMSPPCGRKRSKRSSVPSGDQTG